MRDEEAKDGRREEIPSDAAARQEEAGRCTTNTNNTCTILCHHHYHTHTHETDLQAIAFLVSVMYGIQLYTPTPTHHLHPYYPHPPPQQHHTVPPSIHPSVSSPHPRFQGNPSRRRNHRVNKKPLSNHGEPAWNKVRQVVKKKKAKSENAKRPSNACNFLFPFSVSASHLPPSPLTTPIHDRTSPGSAV